MTTPFTDFIITTINNEDDKMNHQGIPDTNPNNFNNLNDE